MDHKSSVHHSIFFRCLIMVLMITGCSAGVQKTFENKNLFTFNRKIHGSGIIADEKREVADFSEIILSEEGDLVIEIGEHEELTITAEDNILPYLKADVKHGVLTIYKSPANVTLEASHPIKYHLIVTEITSLQTENSGDVDIYEIQGEKFSIVISSSGDVRINSINVNHLSADLTSSGEMIIYEGYIKTQQIRLTSSSSYHGENVESDSAIVTVSSSGEAYINITQVLEASLTSSGNIYYRGDPYIHILKMSSTGTINRMP